MITIAWVGLFVAFLIVNAPWMLWVAVVLFGVDVVLRLLIGLAAR